MSEEVMICPVALVNLIASLVPDPMIAPVFAIGHRIYEYKRNKRLTSVSLKNVAGIRMFLKQLTLWP
jgi:hypothetical protein